MATCSKAQFEANPKGCPADSEAGFVEMEAVVEAPLGVKILAPPLTGTVYNLDQEPGLPLLFGITVAPLEPLVSPVNLFLEGHVSSGDYHEYFEINNVPREVEVVGLIKSPLKVLKSKLFFNGHAGKGNFLTLPSVCSGPPTSYLEVESWNEEVASTPTIPPVGIDGCRNVPFEPSTQITPETSQYDTPDGIVTEVRVPQKAGSTEINTADIQNAVVKLPEGLTLDPSAAHGLEACTPAEIGFKTESAPSCPAGSKLGTVTIETDLPPGSLSGSVYLGDPAGLPVEKPPFTIYLVAQSIYEVSVKLEGTVHVNEETGRLEVSFENNPQLPFSDLILRLNGGARAPLANPLACGTSTTDSVFTAYSGEEVFKSFTPSTPFTTSGCPSPVPFAVAQGTSQSSSKGGAFTSFTFNLSRGDGQQYLSKVQTTLPAGLVGLIPSVKLCGEPQAQAGSCPTTSQIGTATASAGAGTEPYGLSGPVYLTGPTAGAPYGLSIPIEAAAGPFDLGRVTTRVAIGVDPHKARVIATATLPTIRRGVPLRLRTLSVAITKSSFLFNPTNCGALSTDSALTSTGGASDRASSGFQVSACTSLPFKPAFSAASPTAPSRANGASLLVSFTQPNHQANIRSVVAQLPKELPSRLTTLHQACAEGVFAANPRSCPSGSKVGSATVTTPVLPEKLTGPAYLVSHGGAAFPDLDLILEGDHGVRVVLEGNTNIKGGVTTSTFASIPDVPVSSFELSLPTGPNSALGSFGTLCAKPLYMPMTITAQSGVVTKRNVRLSIGSCKIKLLSHRVRGHKLILEVETFTAGRVSVTSGGLHTTYRHLGGPAVTTLEVPLSNRGRHTPAGGRHLRIDFRVGFLPEHKDEFHSAAFATVTFRH